QEQEDARDVQRVPMDVLQNERECLLTPVTFAGLAHGTRRWIRPERLVVRAAVVIAGEAEEARERKNQQGGGERKQCRKPGRLGAEPRMLETSRIVRRRPQHWCVKRRQIGSERVVRVLKSRPRRIDQERPETNKDRKRCNPPCVAAARGSEP